MSGAKIRTIPTTMVTGFWDEGSDSDVPERVKIFMSDGSRAEYVLAVKQPKPNTLTPHEIAMIFRDHVYGGYKHGK